MPSASPAASAPTPAVPAAGPDRAAAGAAPRRQAARTGVVLGVEAGSTLVEAVVATVGGEVIGRGRSALANPTALPIPDVVAHLSDAVRQAMGTVTPASVAGVVVGAAGILRYSRGSSAEALAKTWVDAGLTCPVLVVADAVTAFAAGTPRPSGSVLIAGVGSIAARVEGEEVTARIDGNGWLVGDDGSGFWIGRQAVRAVFAALDGRSEPTLLAGAVLSTVTDDVVPQSTEEQIAALRDAVYDGPPIALAALAPLVSAAATAGDRVAQRIVDRAVSLLMATATALTGDNSEEPLVLAGSLLTAPGPIGAEVQRRLAEHHGGTPLIAAPGAVGAAWLAARVMEPGIDAGVHARLAAGAGAGCQE
ncbi:N-acetylglucosamine kinase [Catenulispora sp. NF23]|uniref:N-acetylglucosamine kinase n=1 Tax=Catenulispora pinistramenti TaxID=2705254 RepID=UPI001BA9B23E|nr:BadF/BadG/BcrA/BcrD ATPase family protein [Catenulispora pinistramenti]MBS2533360.1 N-acetylglucosamine kinase [Catenulispora pinistramenti]